MKNITEKYNLEEIKQKVEELKIELAKYSYRQQHGRAGESLENPYEEYDRLLNNLRSRQTRARKKALEQKADKAYNEILDIHKDEDKYGIRPVDERRYKGTFKSGYIGAPVHRSYIKRMTGLNLMQMYILQEKTGLIPTPKIREAEAKADWKHRYETGDIY